MTAAFSDFYPELLVHVPGAPDPLIDQAILNAAQEFCRETAVWQETLDSISTRPNVGVYELPLPTKTRSVLVVAAMHHGTWLRPRTTREMDRLLPDWRTMTASAALYFASDVQGTIILSPIPTARESRAITHLRVALTPANDATNLPDILYDDYKLAIKYGALMFLHQLPKRAVTDWVNPALAVSYEEMFRRQKGMVKIQVAKGFQAGPTYVRSGRLAGAP